MTKRYDYIDNIKGALIFLVVFCHLLANSVQYSRALNTVYVFFYIFHIPLFVFVSGFLSRNGRTSDTALLKFLGLYLFTSMSTTVFSDAVFFLFSVRELSPGILGHQMLLMAKNCVFSVFLAMGPSWYLLSLILWRLITPHFKKRRVIIFSLAAAVLVGGVAQIEFAMSLSRTIVFYPFYLLGYFTDKELPVKFAEKTGKPAVRFAAAAVLAGFFILVFFYIKKINSQMLYAFSSYATCGYSFIHGALWRCLILVSAAVMSLCFLILIPRRRIFTAAWGTGSLSIYIWHIFLMPVVANVEALAGIGGWFSLIVLAAAAGACALFSMPAFDRALQKIKNGANRLIFGSASADAVLK